MFWLIVAGQQYGHNRVHTAEVGGSRPSSPTVKPQVSPHAEVLEPRTLLGFDAPMAREVCRHAEHPEMARSSASLCRIRRWQLRNSAPAVLAIQQNRRLPPGASGLQCADQRCPVWLTGAHRIHRATYILSVPRLRGCHRVAHPSVCDGRWRAVVAVGRVGRALVRPRHHGGHRTPANAGWTPVGPVGERLRSGDDGYG